MNLQQDKFLSNLRVDLELGSSICVINTSCAHLITDVSNFKQDTIEIGLFCLSVFFVAKSV